jgi:hypothetical protein
VSDCVNACEECSGEFKGCRAYVDAADMADAEYVTRLHISAAGRAVIRNFNFFQVHDDPEALAALEESVDKLSALVSDDG